MSATARGDVPDRPARPASHAASCIGILVAIAAFSGCGRAPETTPAILTNARQVRQLAASQAKLGVPVRIQGILTYFDRLSNYCIIQDSTGGVRVALAAGQIPPAVGGKVELSGLAASAGEAPLIVDGRLSDLGPGTLPKPLTACFQHLRDPEYAYKRVVVSGVVQAVNSERPGLVAIQIRAPRGTIWAKVPASIVVVNDDWLDGDVRATGVLATNLDRNTKGADPLLWVADTTAIDILSVPKPPGALDITPVHEILALPPDRLPAHRVRIKGIPYSPAEGGLGIADGAARIRVRTAQDAGAPPGAELDVAGFLTWENGRALLDRAVLAGRAGAGAQAGTPEPGSVLTTAREAHSLPNGVARFGYDVRLRAVVTFSDPVNHLLFVQDHTDGIFVEPRHSPALRAGDSVEITGVTAADFAPDVAKAQVKVIGHRGLPAPGSGNFESAIRGREDCHWIELGGVVQRAAPGQGDTLLTLAWGRERYKAHVLAPPQSLASLVDAEVRIRGVCGALFNGKRQMLGIQMFVPGREQIRVLRPAPADPFSMPPSSVEDLMKFSMAREMGHRVRLRGAVTYGNRAGSTWIRDSTGGVMMQDLDAQGLALGDLVDAVGFPAIAGFGPVLRGAQVRKVRSGAPPAPVRVTAEEALRGDFDGQLVQIEGRLIDRLQQPAERVLTVESGGTIFEANIPTSGEFPLQEPGALLRMTGICSVEVEQAHDLIMPRSFRLLLRSPADIVVIKQPPWLTAGRVAPVLAGALLLFVGSLAWAGLLRRRVRAQTQVLHAQTVQLRAAHQRTQEALEKAREAEALDLDGKRIVELIARDEPVDLIIDHIAEAVALHSEGAVCAILLAAPQDLRIWAVPNLPKSWMEALGRIDLNSISFSSEFREPKQFSDSRAWTDFIASQPAARFRTFCSAPIVVDTLTAGVIAAFFRSERPCADAQGEQLALWCNIAALALDRRRLHDQLSYRAQHDGLTSLPNRAFLYDRLESEIALAAHGGGLLGLLYIDLDGFKSINDTHGHGAGDFVLQQTARRMTQSVRRGDTVARVGGDEFVVLLPRLARREDAQQIAAKIETALREPIDYEHQHLSVGASVGISIWPFDGDQPDRLLRSADTQMYGEKRRRWYDAVPAPSKVPGSPQDPAAAGQFPVRTAAKIPR